MTTKPASDKTEMPVAFKQTLVCPICNETHEVNYMYKGSPLLACPKMEPDKIYWTENDMSTDKTDSAKPFDLDAYVSAYMAQHNRSGANCGECFKEGYSLAKKQLASEILAAARGVWMFNGDPRVFELERIIEQLLGEG